MIDPTIALGIQQPHINTPQEVQAQRLQLGALMSGQALQQQALQSGALKLQQEQRTAAGQEAMRKELAANTSRNADGTLAIDYGRSIGDLAQAGYTDEAFSLQSLQQQQKMSAITQQQETLKAKKANNEYIGGLAQSVLNAPAEMRPRLWQGAIEQAVNAGIPEAPSFRGMPYDEGLVHTIANQSMSAQQQMDIQIKELQTKADLLKGTAAKTEADTKQDEWTVKKPGEQADSVQKQLSSASMQLASARNPQDYQSKYNSLPPEIAANFPPPQAWQGARTGAAVIKIGMTPAQQTNAAAEQQRNAIAGGELQLNQKKFSMLEGPDAVNSWVSSMKGDPDTWKDVPPGLKTAVSTQWQKETGLPVPRQLPADVKSREEASQQSLAHIQNVRQLLNDPDLKGAVGPVLGRLGTMEQNVGDTFFKTGVQAQKEQQLRTALSYLFGQEGRALFGGRPPEKLMKELHKSSANPNMSLNMMLGALDGAEGSARRTISTAQQYRFNGKTLPGTPGDGPRKSLDAIFGGQK